MNDIVFVLDTEESIAICWVCPELIKNLFEDVLANDELVTPDPKAVADKTDVPLI